MGNYAGKIEMGDYPTPQIPEMVVKHICNGAVWRSRANGFQRCENGGYDLVNRLDFCNL